MDATDIMLDDDKDLLIEGGDFVIDLADEQHIELILLSNKGQWRNSPLTGVGIFQFIGAPFTLKESDSLKQKIMLQLELDGYRKREIEIKSFSEIKIDATR